MVYLSYNRLEDAEDIMEWLQTQRQSINAWIGTQVNDLKRKKWQKLENVWTSPVSMRKTWRQTLRLRGCEDGKNIFFLIGHQRSNHGVERIRRKTRQPPLVRHVGESGVHLHILVEAQCSSGQRELHGLSSIPGSMSCYPLGWFMKTDLRNIAIMEGKKECPKEVKWYSFPLNTHSTLVNVSLFTGSQGLRKCQNMGYWHWLSFAAGTRIHTSLFSMAKNVYAFLSNRSWQVCSVLSRNQITCIFCFWYLMTWNITTKDKQKPEMTFCRQFSAFSSRSLLMLFFSLWSLWLCLKGTFTIWPVGFLFFQLRTEMNVEYPWQMREFPERAFDLDVNKLLFSGRNASHMFMEVCAK